MINQLRRRLCANDLTESQLRCHLDNGREEIAGAAQLFEFVRGDLNVWFARVEIEQPFLEPVALMQLALDDGRRGKCFFRGQTMCREGESVVCRCDVVGVTELKSPSETAE